MFSFLKKGIFSSPNQRILGSYQVLVKEINELESDTKKLSDVELKDQTNLLRKQIKNGRTLDETLPKAFSAVREAAVRTLGQRHYDVQILGGIALHNGKIAEMKTGEGKTLVSTLAAYLNALEGKGVHIVTVNDYLAKRDSEWMGNIFRFLGLSVGYIFSGMDDAERKFAYKADITYGTNNEFGFDYLRDNMKFDLEDMCQRKFSYAIIDEVDSILVDEARTPLIISGAIEDNTTLYKTIHQFVKNLGSENYDIEEKSKSINLNQKGIEFFEKILSQKKIILDKNLYSPKNISTLHYINQSLKANFLFYKDKDYIVKDNQVIIVDEFTGRMMEGRRYSEGLHQAIEAKENVNIQNENQTLASITFQNYFRMYPKLSGMTGTAKTEAAEFSEIYALEVVEIPTYKEMIRSDNNDEIYRTSEEKWTAVVNEIIKVHNNGQPILVGTTNIQTSELISRKLKKFKIKHQVLNARYHEREANIISQAGKPYAVTIATNMAGRGTDIQLGGNVEQNVVNSSNNLNENNKLEQDQDRVKKFGGLYVLGTERHESRRIDNQLRGRSGRQGDPGVSKFYISLQDDLMRIFGSEKLDSMLRTLGLKDGESIFHPWINKAIEKAQSKVENRNFEIRKNLLKFDDVMNDQRKVIYEQRLELLNEENIDLIFLDMLKDTIKNILENNFSEDYETGLDFEKIKIEFKNLSDIDISDFKNLNKSKIEESMLKRLKSILSNKIALVGEKNFKIIQRQLIVQILDQQWKSHLLGLDQLRQGIGLRAYAQRDPLNEYKREAFSMFEEMLISVRLLSSKLIMMIEFKENTNDFNNQENNDYKKSSSNSIKERLRKKN